MAELDCPYCGHWFDLDHDDGQYYSEDGGEAAECPSCGKNFMVYSSMHWTHTGEKADCLNGEPHDWQQMIGAPKEYFENRERCADCDEERVRP